jgi:hypothetical protein
MAKPRTAGRGCRCFHQQRGDRRKGEGRAIGDRTLRIAILLGLIVLVVVLPVSASFWMTSVPGRSHTGPLPQLTPDQARMAGRLRGDIEAAASFRYPHYHSAADARSARTAPPGVFG